MGRVTINDIARLSGYSKTSVSFAFNAPSRISERARDKIMKIADELGYVPDPSARSLSMRRHGSIGLLLPQIIPVAFLNPYLSQIVQGIGEVCEDEGYSLTLIPPIRESIIDGVKSAAVDGLITLGLQPGMPVVQMIVQRNLPFVTIDGHSDAEDHHFPVIHIDDRAAAYHLMRHVLAEGHREIAILSFGDDTSTSSSDAADAVSHVASERLAGYRAALAEFGLLDDSSHVECESSIEGGREAVGRLLDRGPLPTAVVAMSDIIALGVYEGLEHAGLAVPEDVSVVGFDDIPESRIIRPRLTTVVQPGFEKGRLAARLLMEMVGGKRVVSDYQLASRLVVRGSCAAPRATR